MSQLQPSPAVPPPSALLLYDAGTAEVSVTSDARMAVAGALVGALLWLLVRQRKDRVALRFVQLWIVSFLAFGAWGAWRTVEDHRRGAALLSAGSVTVHEGIVAGHVPASRGTDGSETFALGGESFRVPSAGERGPGLRASPETSGVFREGRRLRIWAKDGIILRVTDAADAGGTEPPR